MDDFGRKKTFQYFKKLLGKMFKFLTDTLSNTTKYFLFHKILSISITLIESFLFL